MHAMTDFSHELVDDARLSHLNPADVFKCPSCGCCDCNFTCGLYDTEEESVEHWNTRTVDVDKLATVANSLAVQEDPYCRDMADKIRKAAGL